MKILVDDQPVRIVAAKPGTAFWDVPKTLSPGPHRVTVSPGPSLEPVMSNATTSKQPAPAAKCKRVVPAKRRVASEEALSVASMTK
jgi:hypothetical protein